MSDNNTYGVYFEFDSSFNLSWAERTVGYVLKYLDAKISHFDVQALTPPAFTLQEHKPQGVTHDFFDGIPSVDEDDVFAYPHIKELLDHLEQQKREQNEA